VSFGNLGMRDFATPNPLTIGAGAPATVHPLEANPEKLPQPRRPVGRVHPDRRVQAVVEQVREAEMVQAIDRLRLIHSEREKTVVILCNIPLDLPVDELMTWRELTGDGRLLKALEICEENGWEALPLAVKELTRLFPDLWSTRKAAEYL
jgi:hypothetical protein